MAGPLFTLRAATAADDADWARLRHALWPDCPPERHAIEVELYQRSPGVVALAHETASGEAIGFAEVSIRRDHVSGTTTDTLPYLEGWYVDAAWRGRGVGRALLDFVIRWAREAGYRELASDAELDNLLSQAVHTRLGFRETERTVHYVMELPPADAGTVAVRTAHAPTLVHAPRVAAGQTIGPIGDRDPKNPGWFEYADAAGNVGYCPVAWFDLDPEKRIATARRDYDASELAVAVGDQVRVLETVAGWHRVASVDGRVGWIPAKCLGSN